jgi:hypothetical protein
MDGCSVTREAHHAAPRCLISLHEKANGTTSLDGEGIQAWLVCDECYAEHASVLVIVPGERVVMARCDHCWCYGNPREFVVVSPGGRKNAYSGTCATCVGEEGS